MKSKINLGIIAVLLITGCSNLQPTKTYTVQFETNGGSIINPVIIPENSLINLPDTSKEGHTLEGWYTSLNGGETLDVKWNFFSDRVNFDFTLYAKWDVNDYTISFESNGGNIIQSQSYEYGENLIMPIPTKTGHSFVGWYLDIDLTNAFSLTTMPANDLNVYAKWSINQYTISFESNGGSLIQSITLDFGEPITAPSDPTREGYTFSGWYSDANLTQLATIPNLMPDNNFTLYAKWRIVSSWRFIGFASNLFNGLNLYDDFNHPKLGFDFLENTLEGPVYSLRINLFPGDNFKVVDRANFNWYGIESVTQSSLQYVLESPDYNLTVYNRGFYELKIYDFSAVKIEITKINEVVLPHTDFHIVGTMNDYSLMENFRMTDNDGIGVYSKTITLPMITTTNFIASSINENGVTFFLGFESYLPRPLTNGVTIGNLNNHITCINSSNQNLSITIVIRMIDSLNGFLYII